MNQVIPILPCPDVRAQATFYQQLGFELVELYTAPNPYVVMRYAELELHFYGNRRIAPAENSSMVYLRVDDVDAVCAEFSAGLKRHTNKIPRSGLPRISKVKDLSQDRRFTLTDTGGNTFYVGTPFKDKATDNQSAFFRQLADPEKTKRYTLLYDLVYSKEDPKAAAKVLKPLLEQRLMLSELDQAKLLLVAIDCLRLEDKTPEPVLLQALDQLCHNPGADWDKIRLRRKHQLAE